MQVKIFISSFLAALAPLGALAHPTQMGNVEVAARTPKDDWKTPLGWDGKVTPIEKVGKFITPKVSELPFP